MFVTSLTGSVFCEKIYTNENVHDDKILSKQRVFIVFFIFVEYYFDNGEKYYVLLRFTCDLGTAHLFEYKIVLV